MNKKIIDFEKKIKKQKDKKKKENYIQKLNTYKESLASLSVENPEFTQTMINNYTYNLIRSAMEEEARKKSNIARNRNVMREMNDVVQEEQKKQLKKKKREEMNRLQFRKKHIFRQ